MTPADSPLPDHPLDLNKVDRGLRALKEKQGSGSPESITAGPRTWTAYDDFQLRCHAHPGMVDTVRCWIRNDEYWKIEHSHWDTIDFLLLAFEDDEVPPMRELKAAFDRHQAVLDQARAYKTMPTPNLSDNNAAAAQPKPPTGVKPTRVQYIRKPLRIETDHPPPSARPPSAPPRKRFARQDAVAQNQTGSPQKILRRSNRIKARTAARSVTSR
ncbi:hypothetical protein K461DRAFT_319733 [Myriangium duriaei CBS 260.36]|uniref:Uncharacterized protein n=1 Tax=Myriangium duriaei CBS 260.36 TaxID=1168546 RepID=A0A9P4J4J7_9PEZI|nr:hypothetical protein K461DRAFT_319733 [Myriangium duriaei CBS 260.36]